MSIIISMVSDQCAITASDGRLTGSANIEENQVVTKAIIINDNFDKTFTLAKGKIIGAFCGTVQFDAKSIADHLSEIFQTDCQDLTQLADMLDCLTLKLKSRLENSTETLLNFKKIDLIINASDTGKLSDFRTYTYRFKPNTSNDRIIIENEIIPPSTKTKGLVYWQLFGDDNSQMHLKEFLESSINKLPSINANTLTNLAYKAIRHGIMYAGKHPYGDHQSCGGKPFVKVIK